MVDKSTSHNFEVIFERIKFETKIKSIRQLAEIIGKTHSTILAAKTKNNFPAGWAYLVGKKYGILTEWIMTGEGPKRLEELQNGKKIDILNELKNWLLEEIRKNPKKEVWFEIQLEESFPGFKAWKEEKEGSTVSEATYPSSKVA